MYMQIETVEEMLKASRESKVLVFKHSSACPSSGRAKAEVDGLLADNPDLSIYLVVVQQQRDISNQIEDQLGVRHETPQLLLIENGEVTENWHHFGITREAVGEALG